MAAANLTPPHSSWKPPPLPATLSVRADMVGITVIATIRLRPTAQLMATAISANNCPISSSIRITGANTAMVVRVLASTAPQTSLTPSQAALKVDFPVCL